MKFKLLPLVTAISTILSPMSLYAEDVSQVNAINAELTQPADPLYDRQQPLVLTKEMTMPDTGLKFTGYARFGLHYSDDIREYVRAEGQMNNTTAGRLGNEGNGGEFQFTKAFIAENGAIWDVAVMLEHWDDDDVDVNLKKFYAGATNIFTSQPNAYIWAGRDFHQRPQQGINDYFWMTHDGQGAGVYNLDLMGIKFDISAVAQVDGVGDNGNYAITSKIHGISLGGLGELSILTNYGFESDNYDEHGELLNDDKTEALQIATVVDSQWSMGSTQFILRYAENADNSVFTKDASITTLYASLSGNIKTSESWNTEYLVGYHDYESDDTGTRDDGVGTLSRTNYSVIVRPMYTWNTVHSTWLEAGYSLVDFDDLDENSAWKVTLSQNVSFDVAGARPMLRFYATFGEADNQVTDNSYDKKQDTLALGAMFESWW